MDQRTFLTNLCENNPNSVIIGSIGTISYDLKDIPHDNKILIKGAMGAALGCALGYALHSNKNVIVVIGDGSLLMHLGSMAAVMKHKPANLSIHVINNASYRSCGGQSTDFDAIKHLVPFEIHNISS